MDQVQLEQRSETPSRATSLAVASEQLYLEDTMMGINLTRKLKVLECPGGRCTCRSAHL